jgi:hypothetical protein
VETPGFARAQRAYLDGDVETARAEVLATFAAARLDREVDPEVWDAFATLCAKTDFDATEVVVAVPDSRTVEVLTALRNSAPLGVDRIADLIWARDPEDASVLALVPRFAAKLECSRATEWSTRMRRAGMGRSCPLAARAEDPSVDVTERVSACVLLHTMFGDRRARVILEQVVPRLSDEELAPVLQAVLTTAAALADTVAAIGASTARRSLAIATVLFEQDARTAAYSMLVHGLSMESAELLTTDEMLDMVPVPVLYGLAAEAETRGDEDVAGILEAVAVTAVDW